MRPDSVNNPGFVVGRDGLQRLIDLLVAENYDVIGPRFDGAAVVLGPITRLEDLPLGIADEQEAGRYRAFAGGRSLFGFSVPGQGSKRYLYPPAELLLRARRDANGVLITHHPQPWSRSQVPVNRQFRSGTHALRERRPLGHPTWKGSADEVMVLLLKPQHTDFKRFARRHELAEDGA